MSVVELPPLTDHATVVHFRGQVHFKFQKGNLLMAMNETDPTNWELVKVKHTFTYWLLDAYAALYVVSYADGRTRVCVDTDLRYLCSLLNPKAYAKY